MSDANPGYPKIQYSFFIKGDQIVIRADSPEELSTILASFADQDEAGESYASISMNAVAGIVAAGTLILPDKPQSGNSGGEYRGRGGSAPPAGGKACPKCGKTMTFKEGTSKAGKPYKAWFCSSDDRSHTIWEN